MTDRNEQSSRPDSQLAPEDPSRLDAKGRCCGRKPIFYKGGSWRSPPGSPMYFCCECDREFGPDGRQRPNWKYKKCPGCETWISANASACGECICEVDTCD